ncbi:MAG TPA: diacylglycerol kinase family protein [Ktedonobacteraceae bacterium]|jgi:diacylglycerol kinase (ATP)|nr:diacylglycerol kinase family protein [Ktedonobacteraceae bacterium]
MESAESSDQPLIILNPAANRGRMEHFRALMRSRAAQGEAEYVETSRAGEAKERALHAAGEGRAVIIVGGDGSVNEVVNGILTAGRRVPLGIVAAGSGNDYAWNTLKLPRDPAAALERALHGQLIDTDAGIVNGQYFANSFSIGLDANVAVAADWLKKIPLMSGARLYYTATVQQILFGYHRCPWLKFNLDGDAHGPAEGRRYVLVAVTNGPTYGAGFRINPTADPCDGLFDICSIDYRPVFRALRMLPVVRRGEHSGLPEITFYRAKSVHIESRSLVNMQVDGETTCAATFDATILPGALCVRV